MLNQFDQAVSEDPARLVFQLFTTCPENHGGVGPENKKVYIDITEVALILDPETAQILQVLDPEIVKMGFKCLDPEIVKIVKEKIIEMV